MKKLVSLLLIVLALSVFSCGDEDYAQEDLDSLQTSEVEVG